MLTATTDINLISASRALVFDSKQRLLLVSEDNKFWYLPGGYQETNETIIATAERETYEETGIIVEAQRTVAVSEYITEERFDPHYKYTHKVEHYVLCELKQGSLSEEWKDMDADFVKYRRFFSQEDLQHEQLTVKPEFLLSVSWQTLAAHAECYLEFENRLPTQVNILTKLDIHQ